MRRYAYSTLSGCVNDFRKKKVLVLGDLLLDQFIRGEVSRISPEAPVPVVWVKKEGYMPGGACNVACNLAKLGAEVVLAGVVGDDEQAGILKARLERENISTDYVITDKKRPTIIKTRVIANHQQVVRIDRESTLPVSGNILEKVKPFVKEHIEDIDGIIIEDYGKGMISPSLLRSIVPFAKRHGKIIAVDPKESHFSYYKGASVITPNHHEAEKAVGFAIDDEKSLLKAGERLVRKLNAEVILLTLGERGMMVFEKGRSPHRIPTMAQEVFDVSGAGDTVIAVYTLSVISGRNPVMAAHIANCAAGIVVGKESVAVVEKKELLVRLKQVAR